VVVVLGARRLPPLVTLFVIPLIGRERTASPDMVRTKILDDRLRLGVQAYERRRGKAQQLCCRVDERLPGSWRHHSQIDRMCANLDEDKPGALETGSDFSATTGAG